MDAVLGIALNGMVNFILIFIRMTGLFVIAPIFGRRNIPTYFKVGFSFMLSIILASTARFKVPAFNDNIYILTLLVIQEFVLGVIIGYIAYLIFSAIYLAGQLIDMQIGFGMVNVIDPINSIQVAVTANFYYIITMLVFLLMNGQHILIKALFDSFTAIPPGGAWFDTSAMLDNVTRLIKDMMLTGFKISAPIVATVLIADIALGVIMKTIPQLNIFVAGVPLKLLIGLVVIWLMIPLFILIADSLISNMGTEVSNMIKILTPR